MDIQLVAEQKQVMSQRMIQSTEILQMNTQELTTYIKEQELENPLIELKEGRGSEEEPAVSELEQKLDWLNQADEQNRVYYREEQEEAEAQDAWNVACDLDPSLSEYVLSQLIPLAGSRRTEEILYYMAESLDSRGYLAEDLKDIAEKFDLGEAEAAHYLYLLQSVDPAGIGARSIQECLLLQLDRMPEAPAAARMIIMECLELLGRNQIPQISSQLGLSLAETKSCCQLIRGLNPKPGSGFADRENLRYIRPDVTVIKFRDYFQFLLNDNSLPRITINSYYSRMLKSDASEETKSYIRSKMNQAEWIIQCISHRGDTLMGVTRCIVDLQKPFFEHGPGNRRPMKLADVAAALELHESTVSRAVRDKYLQCSWGVFPMAYFFTRAVGGEEEKAGTADQIHAAIRGILEKEDKKKPLSDNKIAKRLEDMGISISRRTVAKYRAEMGIRDASGRKIFD